MSTNAIGLKINTNIKTNNNDAINILEKNKFLISENSVGTDYDPLVDIKITINIKQIRALDVIDIFSNPDFYVVIQVNDLPPVKSPVWYNNKYIKNPEWSPTFNVPDDVQNVTIKIQLWDKNIGKDKLCDISKDYDILDESRDVEIIYSIITGHWWMDDGVTYYPEWDARDDTSGYGRLNGCDDGSIYQSDRDCELIFDITQNDYDGDGIPYWMEENIYNTDPLISDIGYDPDNDGVPIEWEFKWGHYTYYDHWRTKSWMQGFLYDPFTWEDHASFDFDEDGLSNVEEYKAEAEGFLTDPGRKDILLEIDQMKIGPNGQGSKIPELTKELLWDAYSKHNILFQIDDQGQVLPFDINTSGWNGPELQDIYYNYFLNGDVNNWRRGAFHYAPIVYKCDNHPGNMWNSEVWNRSKYPERPENRSEISYFGDCFQVSTRHHNKLAYKYPIIYAFFHKTLNKETQRAIIYATAMMHETGHVLGIFHSNVPGCDNSNSVNPWDKEWWIWITYHSCMNYGWMYKFVDYSDGSNGKYDFDDWSNIDLTRFQTEQNPDFSGF
jgi:hypothetical protein